MSVYRGIGILRFKLPEQGKQGLFLLGRARILMSLAIGRLAPDVADAYAMGIVSLAMSANFLDGTASVDASVSVYHIVIADSPEASVLDGNTRPPDLPLEKFVCRSGSNS